MVSAIIVAAGRGTRMGPNIDKLFLEVGGQPLIAHTWRRFDSSPDITHITLVVRDGMQNAFEELARGLQLSKPFRLVPGGPERQDSVWNGLVSLPSACEIVAVQDGARPCTNHPLIAATIAAARRVGAAVAAQRVTDTIKASDGGNRIAGHLDRSRLWAVQTPQTFHVAILRRALAAVKDRGLTVTDDTAACECIGQPVELVEDPSPNPKATSPADLPMIEQILRGLTHPRNPR